MLDQPAGRAYGGRSVAQGRTRRADVIEEDDPASRYVAATEKPPGRGQALRSRAPLLRAAAALHQRR